MSDIESGKTRRERELEILKKLPRAEFSAARPIGVLLSDQIRHYVDNHKLIHPFNEGQLKRAGYELSVGEVYSVAGHTRPLSDRPGENELRIEPFEVAIIQTHERVNIPDFLIGRWNIRVRWAYKGLLWVGGPQVDPGYQGYLFCPIYNLSDQTVILHRGEPLALLDFVTTTPPTGSPKPYPNPETRSRLLFEDYEPDKLQSALSTKAYTRIEQSDRAIKHIQARVDQFTQITFAVVALLFATLATFAGKPAAFQIWNPTILLATIAFVLALWAFYIARSGRLAETGSSAVSVRSRWPELVVALLVGVVLVALQYSYSKSFDDAVIAAEGKAKSAASEAQAAAAEAQELRKKVDEIETQLKKQLTPSRRSGKN
jgi:deoxycytidine triphosphate deaminase